MLRLALNNFLCHRSRASLKFFIRFLIKNNRRHQHLLFSWIVLTCIISILIRQLGYIHESITDHFKHWCAHGNIIGIVKESAIFVSEVLFFNMKEEVNIKSEKMWSKKPSFITNPSRASDKIGRNWTGAGANDGLLVKHHMQIVTVYESTLSFLINSVV